MKIIVAAIAFLFVTTGAVQAQRSKDSTHHAKKQGMKRQYRENLQSLNLNDAQKAETKALQESYRKQAMDLRNNTSLSQQDRKKKSMELRKEQRRKMLSILTDEQKASFKAEKKDHKKNRHAQKMARKHRDTKK